jgi:type VII secretion protein EccB
MQSALVRKDAVMLHDPMRTHSRATIVGICLAAIGIVGFLIVGLLSPKPGLPANGGIVIAKPSGQVYVVTEGTLTPTFNLASARLFLLAQQQQQSSGGGGGGQSSSVNGPVGGDPTVIKDEQLKDIKKNRLTGIPYGPTLLPSEDLRPPNYWAVCDKTLVRSDLPDGDPDKASAIETTVLAGIAEPGRGLGDNESLLVTAENKKSYLIYKTPSGVNDPTSSAVRAEVNLKDPATVAALRLRGETPRTISSGLLNAIPPVAALTTPQVDNANQVSDVDVDGLRIGTVVSTPQAGDKDAYYVVLKNGVQKIKRTTADLLLAANSVGGEKIRPVAADVIANTPAVTAFDERSFPEVPPAVLRPDGDSNSAAACLGWSVVGPDGNRQPRTQLYLGLEVPEEKRRVRISTPNPDGEKIDYFFMTPGHAAVVRGADHRDSFDSGPIYLISDLGVKFGIPSTETATALGLGKQVPAPNVIVRLLPNGVSLNPRDAYQSFDTVPPVSGEYPNQQAQQGGSN